MSSSDRPTLEIRERWRELREALNQASAEVRAWCVRNPEPERMIPLALTHREWLAHTKLRLFEERELGIPFFTGRFLGDPLNKDTEAR